MHDLLLFNCACFTSLTSMAPLWPDSMLRWTYRYIGSSQNCRCCYRVMLTLVAARSRNRIPERIRTRGYPRITPAPTR